jgi:site-specific DNA recombinase
MSTDVMRCACYARFSSDLQRQTSLTDQVGVARAYAMQQGWTLDDARVYTDAGISGASIDGRPGLQALIAAAAQQPRPFDVFLVDDSSRVARDIADAIRVLQTLKFFGIRVIYISQAIDSVNEQAETLVAVHGLVDGLYLREARAKIRRGLAGQLARGFATGSITFGYRTVPVVDPSGRLDADGGPALLGKRVEIEPSEAAVVRRVFEWYAEGLGFDAIVQRLAEEGRPGPRGRPWRANALRTALGNERYRGLLIWGRKTTDRRPGTRQRVKRTVPREQWHIQERPELRIVSDELWGRVQARRADIREAFKLTADTHLVRGKNAAFHSRHLFSGFLRCGVCGRAVSIVTGGYGSPRYGCPTAWKSGGTVCSNRLTVRAKVADPALLAGLRAELLRTETVQAVTEALAAELNRVLDQRPAERKRVAEALADAERRLANLVQAVEAGTPARSLLEAIRAREADVARLQAQQAAFSEPIEQKLAVMPGWVKRQLENVASLLSGTPERTKTEFRRLGVQFVMHPTDAGNGRQFYQAVGSSPIAQLLAGRDSTDLSTSDVTHLRSVP